MVYEEVVQLEELKQILDQVGISPYKEDSFKWWRDRHDFSDRNTYYVFQSSFGETIKPNEVCLAGLEKTLNLRIPSELQVFCWRLLLNGF